MKPRKTTILSIDGGGIRGIIPAVVLGYIEKKLQRESGNVNATLADYFDLVAGTSTGGILACYYLLPPKSEHGNYFANGAIDLYVRHGKDIFNRSFFRLGVARSKYSVARLESILKDYMGDVTLAETRKNCIITAYDITQRKAVFFTSPEARKHKHRNYLLRDVARATSAAPAYFELATARSLGGANSYLIDGSVFAGNPTMCAIVEANKIKFGGNSKPPSINDLYIVSVGTGKAKEKYDHQKAKNWGAMQWARPMIDILLSASAEVVDYQIKQLFYLAGCSDCYVRLEPELGKAKPEIDNVSNTNIQQLIDAGEYYIKDHVNQLDKIVENLIKNNL